MTPGDDEQELKRCAATDDDDDDDESGFMENPGVSDLQQKECSSSRHLARAAIIIIMSVGALCAANGRSYLQLHMAASTPPPPLAPVPPVPPLPSATFDVEKGQCSSAETECMVDLVMENVTVSTTEDRFFHRFSRNTGQRDHRFLCQVAPFRIATDHWITSFEPLIMLHAPTNASFMHHLNAYVCTEEVVEWARAAENDPDACYMYTFSRLCRLAWAYDKTGGTFRTRHGSGMQLGPRIWLSRLLLVAHYLAPIEPMPAGWAITDRSGVRIALTRQPQVPSAVFAVGCEPSRGR